MAQLQPVIEAAQQVKVSAVEAMSEVEREMEVRARIYQKWVNEGKMSWADGRDRFARMQKALLLVRQAVDIDTGEVTTFTPEVVNA